MSSPLIQWTREWNGTEWEGYSLLKQMDIYWIQMFQYKTATKTKHIGIKWIWLYKMRDCQHLKGKFVVKTADKVFDI